MNYITQETAMQIADKFLLPRGLGKPNWPVIFNKVIKQYLEAQPAKPTECPNMKYCEGQCFQCEYYNAETGRMEYPIAQPAKPVEPNNDQVICPNCVHQFRAIPVNVQQLMLDAGLEPPFKAAKERT